DGGGGRLCAFLSQVGQHVALTDFVRILDGDRPPAGDGVLVLDHLAVFDACDAQVGVAVGLLHVHSAADLGDHRVAFRRLAGFEELFHAGETGGDVTAGGHTTGVEGAQR